MEEIIAELESRFASEDAHSSLPNKSVAARHCGPYHGETIGTV